ncbi:hypothetical protein EON80_03915 [bacterium]|nr:MAG: hypothetical protein EON80_03915 [bacterium]
MALKTDNLFVMVVALLTWGIVFIYLLRVDRMAKALEEELKAHELTSEKPFSSGDPIARP